MQDNHGQVFIENNWWFVMFMSMVLPL